MFDAANTGQFRPLALGLLLLGCVWSMPVSTQVVPADSIRHRNDCRLARQVLEHGHPASKRVWALSHFVSCGPEAGLVAANVLSQHRDDEGFSRELDEIVSAATSLVDGRMAAAALEIAIDPGAGKAARVQALRLLYAQVRPGVNVPYVRIIQTGERSSMDAFGHINTRVEPLESDVLVPEPIFFGTELPMTELSRIGAVIGSLQGTAEAPDVRVAAGHVSRAYRSYLLCPRGTPQAECVENLRSRTRH